MKSRATLTLTALAALCFVLLNWAASCRCLATVSDSLADMQDKTLDLLTKLEYRRAGPLPNPGFPAVRLVEIADPTIQSYSPGSYVFNRGSLAQLLERLEADGPRAVFIDLDLSFPTNEATNSLQLSQGDRRLLEYLKRPRGFPILLNSTQLPRRLLGQTDPKLPSLCWVSPQAILDQDGRVRRIPPTNTALPPAAHALYRIALGEACPKPIAPPAQVKRYEVGHRLVFRELELWRGVARLEASSVLDGSARGLFEGAMVMVGRTDSNSFDTYSTPVGSMPGVHIHLHQLLTLISYGRNVQGLSPWLGAPLAFAFTLLALLLLPLLSRGLVGQLERLLPKRPAAVRLLGQVGLRPDPQRPEGYLGSLERPIMWGSLFGMGAVLLHRSGLFLDYIFPIVGLELARMLQGGRVSKLASRIYKWVMRA
jgi:CHASE2 domain-containing sensor protein